MRKKWYVELRRLSNKKGVKYIREKMDYKKGLW